MFNLRFCFAVVRLYSRSARSFIIKLFVLNIKKINSRYLSFVRICFFSIFFSSVVHWVMCKTHTSQNAPQFQTFNVPLSEHSLVFTQIALNVHDNQACTCPLIHYHTIGTRSVRFELIFVFNFRSDHLGFFFIVMALRIRNKANKKKENIEINNWIWIFNLASIQIEISVTLIFIRLFPTSISRKHIQHTHTTHVRRPNYNGPYILTHWHVI